MKKEIAYPDCSGLSLRDSVTLTARSQVMAVNGCPEADILAYGKVFRFCREIKPVSIGREFAAALARNGFPEIRGRI